MRVLAELATFVGVAAFIALFAKHVLFRDYFRRRRLKEMARESETLDRIIDHDPPRRRGGR